MSKKIKLRWKPLRSKKGFIKAEVIFNGHVIFAVINTTPNMKIKEHYSGVVYDATTEEWTYRCHVLSVGRAKECILEQVREYAGRIAPTTATL